MNPLYCIGEDSFSVVDQIFYELVFHYTVHACIRIFRIADLVGIRPGIKVHKASGSGITGIVMSCGFPLGTAFYKGTYDTPEAEQ